MPGGAWVTLRLHLPLAADGQFWGDRSKCAWTGLGLDALRGGGGGNAFTSFTVLCPWVRFLPFTLKGAFGGGWCQIDPGLLGRPGHFAVFLPSGDAQVGGRFPAPRPPLTQTC